MSKRKVTKREQELELILIRIFETLPQAGEDREVTWEKVGYIRAMCWKGILEEGFLDFHKSHADLDRETRQVIQTLRDGDGKADGRG